MDVHEYQAKGVLASFGLAVPRGVMVDSVEKVRSEVMGRLEADVYAVKAQIHAGGRGKAGGIKLVRSISEVEKVVSEMLGSTLVTHQTGPEGSVVHRVYIEEGQDIADGQEYYISLVLDRSNNRLMFVCSNSGGVEIEELAVKSPHSVVKIPVDPGIGYSPFYARRVACGMSIMRYSSKLAKVLESMYNAFTAHDMLQLEINPMVQLNSGDFMALDAKVTFDDNALYKNPKIAKLRDLSAEVEEEREAAEYGLSYIKLSSGSIGCLVNGAGLAMATMDIVKHYGEMPANFLDVGGGADQAAVTKALRIVLSDKKVKAVLVNIFGGIMRCDVIANGIVEALKQIEVSVPIVVRLSGTHFDLGSKILSRSGIRGLVSADNLEEAAKTVVELVKKS